MGTDYQDILFEEDMKIIEDFMQACRKRFLKRIKMSEKEYDELCKPYFEECNSFDDIVKANLMRKDELQAEFEKNAVREEYSSSGEAIHRGFYCPSLIHDIVVENCKRGRLCKADNPKAVYVHYFDKDDRHIATKKDDYIEYITYSGNKSLGLQFCLDELITVCECEYDGKGRIKSYILVLCDSFDGKAQEYEKEVYTYSEDKLIVENSTLMPHSPTAFNLNKYVFSLEDGYLKSYTADVYNTEDISCEPLDGRTYRIKLKRKI